jgi:hypothetical protein
MATKKTASEANRGKGTEASVKEYLEAVDRRLAAFDWHRNYDAHTAGGRFPRQTGDFQFYMPGLHGVIEAKEVKHDFRLPHGNFTVESVAKCRKRVLAGGSVIVLVHHTTTGLWRVDGLERFRTREGGSWDLSELPTYPTCKDALDAYGVLL